MMIQIPDNMNNKDKQSDYQYTRPTGQEETMNNNEYREHNKPE